MRLIESISAFIALTTAAVLLLQDSEDRAAGWVFFALMLASGAIMALCELASSITKGA